MKTLLFFLAIGTVSFVASTIYYSSECAFETCWYACTILKCKISSFVQAFSTGTMATAISIWLASCRSDLKYGKGKREDEEV
jgi:hypothetical protein